MIRQNVDMYRYEKKGISTSLTELIRLNRFDYSSPTNTNLIKDLSHHLTRPHTVAIVELRLDKAPVTA